MPKTAIFLPQKADFQNNRGFLFRFELIEKKQKTKQTDIFLNYTVPRTIALGAPRIFEVKMGRGDLGVKTKKFVSLCEPKY